MLLQWIFCRYIRISRQRRTRTGVGIVAVGNHPTPSFVGPSGTGKRWGRYVQNYRGMRRLIRLCGWAWATTSAIAGINWFRASGSEAYCFYPIFGERTVRKTIHVAYKTRRAARIAGCAFLQRSIRSGRTLPVDGSCMLAYKWRRMRDAWNKVDKWTSPIRNILHGSSTRRNLLRRAISNYSNRLYGATTRRDLIRRSITNYCNRLHTVECSIQNIIQV